jgi:N-methylhydantoinase A/oxoprolinase/acetone carboxylase beta subunit
MASKIAPNAFRLGIDVGGTNTDVVILDASDQVIASTKSPTTADVTSGIVNALQAVLTASGLPPTAIRYAMLGTTHCTNAIVTRRGLSPVGVIRLGSPGYFVRGTFAHLAVRFAASGMRAGFHSPWRT